MIESHSNSSSRRGSSAGISVSEAPQIETKRNVGGDLYLINQSAVETIKGLKLEDDKRRRSSLFHFMDRNHKLYLLKVHYPTSRRHRHTNINTHMYRITQTLLLQFLYLRLQNLLLTRVIKCLVTIFFIIKRQIVKPSLKIGPIGGISSDEKGLPDDSIMSLPLSESFASLDSINDDYLTMKYQEYTKCRNDHTKSEMKGTKDEGVQIPQQLRRKSSLSESDIPRLEEHFKYNNAGDGTNTITEKFKAFNLGNLMKSGIRGANFTVNDTHKSNTHSNANTGGLSSDEDQLLL